MTPEEFEKKKYSYEVVYQNIDFETRNQIINMWVTDGALGKKEAERRVDEVVVVARNYKNIVVGVCTAYPGIFKPLNKLYYFYRQYVSHRSYRVIDRKDQFSPLTRTHLKNLECNPKPYGIVIYVQNKGITDRILTRVAGWNLYGYSPRGERIAYYNFDESLMSQEENS